MSIESTGPISSRHRGKVTFVIVVDGASTPQKGTDLQLHLIGKATRVLTELAGYGAEESDGIVISIESAQRLAAQLLEAVGDGSRYPPVDDGW